MPRLVTVAMAAKMDLIARSAQTDRATIQAELRSKCGIRAWISDTWFDTDTPTIQLRTRKKLVEYFNNHLKLPFTNDCFAMPLERFVAFLDNPPIREERVTNVPPQRSMKPHAGRYQIVRPHSFDVTRYILEAMEIVVEGDQVKNLMYSHNHLPERRYLYEGQGYVSSRYYSTFMVREHETYPDQAAFRSLLIYVGNDLNPGKLSGLMLRGVSGLERSDQGVCVPFVALRVPDEQGLEQPVAKPVDDTGLFRLHPDSPILLGPVVNRRSTADLFAWCDGVFETLQTLPTGLLFRNQTVMHTVPPADLDRVGSLDPAAWADLVERLAAGQGDLSLQQRRNRRTG